MKRRLAIAAALATIAVLACAGCANSDPNAGWTTKSLFRQDVKTVAVPIFARGAGEYRRNIEMRLTEAVVKNVLARTPYRVVDRKDADTVLSGTLKSVDLSVLSFNPRTGMAREIPTRIVVDFKWEDLRTGQVLREEKDFSATTEYIPEAPFREDFFQGREDTVNRLARLIVEQLIQPF